MVSYLQLQSSINNLELCLPINNYIHLIKLHVPTYKIIKNINNYLSSIQNVDRPLATTFNHLILHSHIYNYIYLITNTFTLLQLHSSIYSYIHPFTTTFINLKLHSSIYSYIHPFTTTFIHLQLHSSDRKSVV